MSHDWKPTSLGEILTLERRPVKLEPEKDYAEIGIYSYGRGIFHKRPRTGFEVGDKDLFLIKKGDFIFQITFAWEGAFGLASEHEDGMYGSVRFPTFRVNEDICYPPFLINYFKIDDGRNQLIKISPGSAGRNRVLNTKRLPEILVPLPPLDEQRRIVKHVEILATHITEAQSLRDEADKEIELLLKSCLSRIFDYEYGDVLPSGWQWKSFNQTLEEDGMRTGPFGTALNNSEIYTEGIPVFGIPNVGNSVFRPGFTDYVTAEKAKSLSVYVLEEGDIAIARSGTVGRSCIVPKLDPKPIMSSNLIRIRINKKVFLPDLMCQILTGSKLVERHIDKECRGSTRIFFTQKILNKFQIPVPPLDEQRRIVAYLDSVQARLASLRELQSQTGEELDALLPSVLDRAFKGEL